MKLVGFAPRPSAVQANVRFGIYYPVLQSLEKPMIPLMDASEKVATFAELPKTIPHTSIIKVADADKHHVEVAVGQQPICGVITSPGGELQIGPLNALRKRVIEEQHLLIQAAAQWPVVARELARFTKNQGLMLRVDAASAPVPAK